MDNATAIMEEAANGSGQFKEATLHPKVVIQSEELIQKAINLHHEANKMCFIANSCNFTIHHEAGNCCRINSFFSSTLQCTIKI